MGAYRTVIGCNFEQYINNTTTPNRYLILDIQDPKQVTNSATIATQPLQDGDTMSDHMYRNPAKVNLSGSFSLNGKNWDDDSYNFISVGDRLTNIEEAFERILNEGILCTITTIQEDDLIYNEAGKYSGNIKSNAKNRFKIRKNMALESINWTESQNTVKFAFSFHEVIMVETQEEYETLSEEELKELGLPNINYPQGSNLGTLLIESGQVPETIIKNLYSNGYIDNDFLEKAIDTQVKVLGAVIVSALVVAAVSGGVIAGLAIAVGTGVMAATTATSLATASVFPVGTLIVAAAVATAAIVLGVIYTVKKVERAKKRKKAFKLVDGSAESDSIRLRNLIDDVISNLNKLETGLTVYNINGNYEQQVVLNIANVPHIINFTKNYTSDEEHYEWTATVQDSNGKMIDTYNDWCPVFNMMELDRNKNLWFKDKSMNFEVYLVNPSLDPSVNDTDEKLVNVKEHLDGYSIWVSDGDIQTQIKRIYQCVDDAITSYGFD